MAETEHAPTLGEVLGYDCDESTGEVYLVGDISMETLQHLLPKLSYLSERLEEITLVAYSPGGSDTAMLGLADYISHLETPVHLQAWGQCSSAATVLFAVCENRVVGPNTEAIFHAFHGESVGDLTARFHRDALTRTITYAQRYATLIAARSSLSYKLLKDIALDEAPEVRLYGVELVQAGLADQVAHPFPPAQPEQG